jgi:esterase/lipase superfamily enzyme
VTLLPKAAKQFFPQSLTYSQRLDHYNHQDDRTWTQRYWIEDSFWSGAAAGGPIFLQLGGEGPENSRIVTSMQMSVYAQTHRALQVGIEHRYYGNSQPMSTLSTENLQWLSSQQALADAAELVLYVREKYKAYNSPIITFGCSYSGALAAFFRIKYPHVTIGSVASSAPVEATLDFYQYLDVVDQSLSYFVGPQCDAIIATATQQIQMKLQSQTGISEMQQKFKICQPLNGKKDISTFMQNLMGNWQGQVQYNQETPAYNVTTLCNQLTSLTQRGMSALDAYASVSNTFIPPNPGCLDCSYHNMVVEMQSTSTQQSMRQWTYQTCTEFAYFQTTDSDADAQPFGDLVPVQYWIDFCTDAFGIDFKPELKVKQTNQHYGGNKLSTAVPDNILFVNGNIDPWHSLSIFEPIPNSPIQTVFVQGTAHCADVSLVGPSRAPPQLLQAQQKISDILGQWIRNYKPLPPSMQ